MQHSLNTFASATMWRDTTNSICVNARKINKGEGDLQIDPVIDSKQWVACHGEVSDYIDYIT